MTLTQDVEILLVEDDAVDAELFLTALRDIGEGVTIHTASDGAEALDYLSNRGAFANRNPESVPKVIFLDLKLPKVNGFEVLQNVRHNARTRAVPVVVFSSSNELNDVLTSYRLGANSYVVKPVNAEEFMKTVSAMGAYWIHCNEVANVLHVKFSA